jgi:RNA polymerase sigma-70 factor (ECF subfamily)
MPTDHNLLDALRRRDPAAFAALFERYSDKLFRLAMGLLADEDEAEGIVQDAFLRLFENLDRFEGRAGIGTWLYRVAYNASVDQLRRRRPTQPLADDVSDLDDALVMPAILTDWSQAPEPLFATAEAQVHLDEAILALPERLRSTFILREIEGLSTAETAEILGVSLGAVKVQLHRARLQLREHLSVYFGERVTVSREG